MPSCPCEQCYDVKQCRMYVDEHTDSVVYMCMGCAQELGYFRSPYTKGEEQ